MIVVWFVLGCGVGLIHMVMQWWTLAHLSPQSASSALGFFAAMIFRWLLAAGLLLAAIQSGIGPGLAAFAGLMLTRWRLVIYLSSRPALFERFDQPV